MEQTQIIQPAPIAQAQAPKTRKPYLPRYKRVAEPPGWERQQDDVRILEWLLDYRFLSTNMVTLLLGRGYDAAARRLKLMAHQRPPLVLRLVQPRRAGRVREPLIYGLSNAGADVLAEMRGMSRGRIDWERKNREPGWRHINHQLLINHFRIGLKIGLEQSQQGELVAWKHGIEVKFPIKGQKPTTPDGFAGVRLKDGSYANFFLEADRSTEHRKRVLAQLRNYWQLWKSGQAEQLFGIDAFRVIIITRSWERRDSLAEYAKMADDRQQGSAMYLLGSVTDFPLTQPSNLLRPIFRCPVDYDAQRKVLAAGGHSLLD